MSSFNVRRINEEKVLELFNTFIIDSQKVDIYDEQYSVNLYNKDKQVINLRYYYNLELDNTILFQFIPKVENLRFDGYLRLTNDNILNKVKSFIAHCIEYDPIKYIRR